MIRGDTADWLDEVKERMKRKNQILFSKDSAFLADLADLIGSQTHRAIVLWALEFAKEAADTLLETYPEELRPQEALAASSAWAQGKVKMPAAQKAILRCHAFAKEIGSPYDIALCHAVGQACGAVHAPGHAIGFPIYELTAIIRKCGVDGCREPVEKRKAQYAERIIYWGGHSTDSPYEWADFMLK
ncbi:MAG: hypothetical protein LBU81_06710 [Methanosarcinales archaeon]|jgi:hypothetical protein|nr:hypothetical protein [Methanosarcinales archaeon]